MAAAISSPFGALSSSSKVQIPDFVGYFVAPAHGVRQGQLVPIQSTKLTTSPETSGSAAGTLVPEGLKGASFCASDYSDSRNADIVKLKDCLQKLKQGSDTAILSGQFGSGKTYGAIAIAKELAQQETPVFFLSLKERGVSTCFDACVLDTAAIIIVDDLNNEHLKESELFQQITRRRKRGILDKVIFTTNLESVDTILATVGLYCTQEIIKCELEGASRRGEPALPGSILKGRIEMGERNRSAYIPPVHKLEGSTLLAAEKTALEKDCARLNDSDTAIIEAPQLIPQEGRAFSGMVFVNNLKEAVGRAKFLASQGYPVVYINGTSTFLNGLYCPVVIYDMPEKNSDDIFFDIVRAISHLDTHNGVILFNLKSPGQLYEILQSRQFDRLYSHEALRTIDRLKLLANWQDFLPRSSL